MAFKSSMDAALRPDGSRKAVERWRTLFSSRETYEALREYDRDIKVIEQEKNQPSEEADATKS